MVRGERDKEIVVEFRIQWSEDAEESEMNREGITYSIPIHVFRQNHERVAFTTTGSIRQTDGRRSSELRWLERGRCNADLSNSQAG
jgi:hypothetical protein